MTPATASQVIRDVTAEFLRPPWTSRGSVYRARREHFAADLLGIQHGLYAATFFNDHDHAVWDANAKPRILIDPRSWMLKYGRFKLGLVWRYFDSSIGIFEHLHHRPPAGSPAFGIYRGLTRAVLVLDLSTVVLRDCDESPAVVFEPYWNAAIERWLVRQGLRADAPGVGESRKLSRAPDHELLHQHLEELAANIDAAARALGTV